TRPRTTSRTCRSARTPISTPPTARMPPRRRKRPETPATDCSAGSSRGPDRISAARGRAGRSALEPRASAAGRGFLLAEDTQDGQNASVRVRFLRQPQLAEDGIDVLLDRSLAKPQPGHDRGVAPARGHLLQDLSLSRGERCKRRCRPLLAAAQELLDDL